MGNKLMVSKSFANWDRIGEPYEKDGKLYQKVRTKCDRCNGRGDYWWGVMINGRPQYSGTCYACWGSKYQTKDVRLYTEEEYERMEKYNEAARAKKEAEREAKMKAEFETKRIEWLAKNGFTEDGYTYIVTGDSYSIKDELKAGGWRYDSVLKWHKADPAGYEDRVIKINVDDYFVCSAWGTYSYKTGAADMISSLLSESTPKVETVYFEEDKLKDIPVELVRKFSFQGKYGITNVFNFMDKDSHLFVWFTSTIQPYEVHDHLIISSATVKDRKEYKDDKQTVITRARLKSLDEAGMDETDYFNWENETLNG